MLLYYGEGFKEIERMRERTYANSKRTDRSGVLLFGYQKLRDLSMKQHIDEFGKRIPR